MNNGSIQSSLTASLLFPFLPFPARVISVAFFSLASYYNEHELLRSCSLVVYLSDIVCQGYFFFVMCLTV